MADWSFGTVLPMLGATAVAVFGAGATFHELQSKPDRAEMREAIDSTRVKLEAKHEVYDAMGSRLESVEAAQERGKDLQEVLLLQADWQSDVLEHIASKRRGKPPAQPEELKDKRRRLMQ